MAELDDIFSRTAGRQPNPQERDYLQGLIDRGEISAFQVGEIVGGLPDVQRQRLGQESDFLQQQLQGQDEGILNRAQDQIQSTFAKQGRTGSSGRLAAFASAAQNLAERRQTQLYNFLQPQISQQLGQANQRGQQARNRGQAIGDRNRSESLAFDNYTRQQNDFNNALRGQSTRNLQSSLTNAGIGLATKGIGAGIGAAGGFGGGTGFASNFAGAFSGLGGSRRQNTLAPNNQRF